MKCFFEKIKIKLDFHFNFQNVISEIDVIFQNFFLPHEIVFNNIDQSDEDVVIAVENMGWQF